MHAQVLLEPRTRSRAAVFVETSIFVNETEGNKFRESAGALLNGTQQQNVADPIGGVLDMPVHHGGGRRDGQLVSRGNDLYPASYRQLVGTELLAHTIV